MPSNNDSQTPDSASLRQPNSRRLDPSREAAILSHLARIPAKDRFYQTYIPPTSRTSYITGIYALNIPDEEGTTGDWHENVFWHPIGIRKPEPISLGGQGIYDTNQIFGDLGVQEARAMVVRIGLQVGNEIEEVFVADHMRAALDLAFAEFQEYGRPIDSRGASSDWLDTVEQKTTFLSHAGKFRAVLPKHQHSELEKWLQYERALD